MRGQEDQRVPVAHLEDLRQRRAVVDQLAIALAPRQADEALDQVDDEGAVAGGDLAQVAARLALDRAHALAHFLGQRREPAPERRPAQELWFDQARHLVPGSAQRPLGPLERQRRRPGHEAGKPDRLRDVLAHRPLPAGAKLRGARRFADHHRPAVGPVRQPVLAKPVGVAGVREGEQVVEARRAAAVPLGRQPGDAQRLEARGRRGWRAGTRAAR